MYLYFICVLGRLLAYIGISRFCEGVFSHSFRRGVNVGAAEERIWRRASSCGLENKEIASWACEHKLRSSLEFLPECGSGLARVWIGS